MMIVVAAVSIFGNGGSIEFAASDDERIFQNISLFQITDQGGNWLINIPRLISVCFDSSGPAVFAGKSPTCTGC